MFDIITCQSASLIAEDHPITGQVEPMLNNRDG